MIKISVGEMKEKYDSEAAYFDHWRDTSKYYRVIMEITERCIKENTRFVSKEKRVLDAGCGTGRNIQTLLELGAQEVTGIDLTPSLLDISKKKFADSGKVKLFLHDLNEKLPFEDESFDIIVCCKTLPHVHNIKNVIKEFSRVLKRQGVMMLDFASPYSFRRLFFDVRGLFNGQESHFRWDSVTDVKRFLREGDNLKIVKIYGQRTFMVAEILVNHFGLHPFFRWLEHKYTNHDFFNRFSGRYNVVVQKDLPPK